jgi:hypothetical protein
LSFSYRVFGLQLRSNVALPGVPPAVSPATDSFESAREAFPGLQLHLATPPPSGISATSTPGAAHEELSYVSSYLTETGQPVLQIWKGLGDSYLRLAYNDGTQFWIDRECRNIWSTWPSKLSLENALSYLLGPVLGLVLRLRGVTCLHASAVVFGENCAVFVGTEGAGKSTTAAAFAKRGHPVLSDDIVALLPPETAAPSRTAASREVFLALPAYPHLYLWPDSVAMVHPAGEPELPPISEGWDKRRLALGTAGTRFASEALPIGAIYLLGERTAGAAPSIRAASGNSSLLSLLANTYANHLLDRTLRAQEFAVLDRLLEAVPVRLLTPHRDPARLGQLCDLVEEDFRLLLAQSPGPVRG